MDNAEKGFDAALLKGVGLLFSTIRRTELAPLAVKAVQQAFSADTSSLMLVNAAGQLYVAFSEVRTSEGGGATGRVVGDGVASRVAKSGRPALIAGSLAADERFVGLVPRGRIGSSMVFPLASEDRLLGVLSANRDPGRVPFTSADIDNFTVFAGYARLALDNMRLYDELEGRAASLAAARSRLAFAERMAGLGHLMARLSHEVNNPAASALANLDFISSALLESSPAAAADPASTVAQCRDAADDAVKSVRHIVAVLRRIDGFVDTGATDMKPVAVPDLLGNVVATLRHEIIERMRVVTDWGDVPTVRGRPSSLSLALFNLVQNCVDAVPPGNAPRHQITLRTRVAPGGIGIEITDTGRGISEADLPRVMEPFFTTKGGGASGLGLTIAREIIEEHGGHIEIASTGPGTTVRVFLPDEARDPKDAAREQQAGHQ